MILVLRKCKVYQIEATLQFDSYVYFKNHNRKSIMIKSMFLCGQDLTNNLAIGHFNGTMCSVCKIRIMCHN